MDAQSVDHILKNVVLGKHFDIILGEDFMKKKVVKKLVKKKIAMFGAGCFWGVEEAFRVVPGVSTEVGYAGGDKKDATYEDVCNGYTGHSEVARITYDPKKIKYEKLVNIFWNIHDPTQMNRQGPDVGSQYRSAIFYFDKIQKKQAEKSLKEEQKKHSRVIATVIKKATTYCKAEDYHQKYIMKGGKAACYV